jgi:hypothetical protein
MVTVHANNITLDEYTEALEVSNKGNFELLKGEPSECMINNYNTPRKPAWEANMDLQYADRRNFLARRNCWPISPIPVPGEILVFSAKRCAQ